jgi:SAM-dependent methyltransferase
MKKTPKLKKVVKHFSRHRFGRCTVCGKITLFFLIDPEYLRNTMICLFCRSASRNRHIAKTILGIVAGGASSIADLSSQGSIAIYNTATDDCFGRVLRDYEGYFSSCYKDGLAPSTEITPRVSCQNIEALTYPDGNFDFVITEDVFEHVRHPEKGFREIYRVLRPGGYHVFTVPFHFDCPTITRVDTSGTEDVHRLPPEYHGDPLRGTILAYRTFGIDLFAQLAAIGFETRVEFSFFADRRCGIFDSSVFVSRRSG